MIVNNLWSGLTPLNVSFRWRWIAVLAVVVAMAAALVSQTIEQPPRITQEIDSTRLVTLPGNVRGDLTADRDLGPVEDALPLRLYMVLQRSSEQQAALDNLVARQQQPTAAEYHKWLTPQEYGARFGASQQDIAKITGWLESQGLQVNGVMNNAMFIDFSATAGQVRDVFRTQLHYYNIRGGKHPANAQDPMIPAALASAVSGIEGLSKIPPVSHHTTVRPTSYDSATHRWQSLDSSGGVAVSPAYTAGVGNYNVTPQDYYTIYNVNPVFSGGNLGAKATVAVIEETDIEYGDVTTFRTKFGVPGTLNMHVYHGYGSVTCNDPGIDPSHIGEEVEAALDAEWANALAPSANLIFMSCDNVRNQGIITSMTALIDNNLADVMSLSYGESELYFGPSDYSFFDTLYSQAATQGQSFFVSAGDSGSDVNDQNNSIATSGINVTAFGGPNVTVAGGTDFSDQYDSLEGGPAQSTYWGANSTYYGDALGYVPETTWNNTCASSLLAKAAGSASPADYCASSPFSGQFAGGSGGFSTHYAVPAYQSGTTGYSGTKRAQPDISGFAANGIWGHALIFCDSYAGYTCASSSSFGEAGGTSFVAPSLAGVTGLLVNSAGRQGLLNPALYALAKAQFTGAATATACYSNGQTSNTGVTPLTNGLPAAGCIFNDVTTSNNDVPCAAGSLNCYVDSGAPYGMLSVNGASPLAVAYPSTAGYDEATGIGTVNVDNLITNWNTAFTSTTGLAAMPTTISSTQSTTLTATVTGGLPAGQYSGSTYTPALSGTVNFAAGSTALGSCPLSSGSCKLVVPGSALQSGANPITATFTGSGTYPTSTSSIVPVTVNTVSSTTTVTLTSGANPSTYGASLTFRAAVTTGATGSVSFYNEASGASCASLGASTPIGSTQTLSGGAASVTTTTLPVGSDTVLACYGGDSTYNSSSGTLAHTVNPATKTSSTTTVTLTSGANPSTYGASLTFRAAVTTGATGSVSFYNEASGASCASLGASTPIGSTQTLSGGAASVTTTTLPVGSDTVLACYGGDSTYNNSSGTLAHTVNPATKTSSTTTVTLTSGANPSTYGASLTFRAAVTTGATGSVSFYNEASGASCASLGASTPIGSTQTLSGGAASVTTTTLPVGSDTVLACYGGDSTYNSSSGTLAHTVNPATKTSSTTTVTLTSGANPSTYGASLTFRAAVTTGATGSVSFYNEASGASCASLGASTPIGSTQTLSGGAASVTTTTLPVGSDTVLACYGGDSTYNSSSGTLAHTVNPATKTSSTTTVTLTSGANPSTYGASLTFRAAVTTGATGSVSFYNEASGASCASLGASTPIGSTQTLSGGAASVTTTTLPVGSDTILACYGGNSTYSSSSGTLAQTVNKLSSTTTVTLTSGANPSTYGASLIFRAAVTTGATGSVSFYNEASGASCASLGASTPIGSTQTLSGGAASVTTTTLPVGSDTILACYGGNSTYSSSSGTLAHTVNPASKTSSTTTVTLTSGANPSTYGASLIFRAAVTTGATGSVSFYNEASGASCASLGASTPIGSTQTLSGGAASVTTTTLPVGSDTVLACYGGDSTYNSSSGTLAHTVNPANKPGPGNGVLTGYVLVEQM